MMVEAAMVVAAHEVARVVLPLASGTPSRSAAPPHALSAAGPDPAGGVCGALH